MNYEDFGKTVRLIMDATTRYAFDSSEGAYTFRDFLRDLIDEVGVED